MKTTLDLMPVLEAAIEAVGGDPKSERLDVVTLENARLVLESVDSAIAAMLGETKIASIAVKPVTARRPSAGIVSTGS